MYRDPAIKNGGKLSSEIRIARYVELHAR